VYGCTKHGGDHIAGSESQIHISGNVSGQVAIGEFVYQAQAPGGVVNQIMVAEPIRALPRPVQIRPRRSQNGIARPGVLADIVDGVTMGPVQVVADDGWGKTSVVAQLGYEANIESYRDGVAVISAWGLDVEDVEQAIFDAFYESTLPDTKQKITPGQLRTSFADITAAIVVDDLNVPRQHVERIMNGCPECAFVSTASTQTMWSEGTVLDLVRMGPEQALKLFEQRLGRSMGTGERDEIAQFVLSVADYPMAIVAAAAAVRRGSALIDVLPTLATAANPIAAVHEQVSEAFSNAETKVLSVLAAVRGAPLPPEAVGVAAGVSDAETHLDALKQDGIIQKASPRYRLAETTASLLNLPDAQPGTVHGLAAWCRQELDPHKIAAAGSAIAIAVRSASEASNYASAIDLGRSADAGLSLSGRWGLWSGVLDEVSSASAHAGDLFTDGWLLHQLGSRSLVTGDAATAGDMLQQAADIRRQIGDAEGLEVTEHNLRLLPPIPPVVVPGSAAGASTEESGFPGWLWVILGAGIVIAILAVLVLPKFWVKTPASISITQTSSIDRDKTVDPTVVSTPVPINYTFAVTNTGEVTLHNVTIDDLLPGVNITGTIPLLAPGATDLTSITGTYNVTQADVDAGTDIVTTATASSDEGAQDTDDATVMIAQTPSIDLVKTGVLDETDGDGFAQAGDTVTYTFTVTNTGNVTLTNVTLADTVGGISISAGPIAPMAPGDVDSSTFTGSYVVTQVDIDAGSFTNTATVRGKDPGNSPVADTDDDVRTFTQGPGLELVKDGAFNDESGDGIAQAGETIGYTFTVTNTGNVTLHEVDITDDVAGVVLSGNPLATLGPAASDPSITGDYVITQADVDAGTFENCAAPNALGPGDTPVNGAEDCTTDDLEQSKGTLGTSSSTSAPTTAAPPPPPPPPPCEKGLTTPGSFMVTLEDGDSHLDADFGLVACLPNTGGPGLIAPADTAVLPGTGSPTDAGELPLTGINTNSVLRIALLLLLIGVEVLITVGKRKDEYSIATLPLSDI
jgi:uncharacterized repeat protein (TIGR01451 family)